MPRNPQRMIRVLLSTAAFGLFVPGVVHAQEATVEPATPVQATPAQGGGGLDVIVVTARKRAEPLQDVPVSITALSGEDLERRNIESIANIAALAPNLNINTSSSSISGAVVSIRGISDNNPTNLANDPPVGLYLDGVYLGRSAGGIFDIVDLERIEVLRGPQGTLFGRNTTGGAVSLVSATPAATPGIQQKVSYGSFDEWSTRTRVDFGEFADTGIALRMTYAHRERDGFVNNILVPDNQDPGAINTDTAFGALHADWDSIRWDVRADYQYRKGVTTASQLQGASPLVVDYYSRSPMFGGRPFQQFTERQQDFAHDFRGFATGELWGVSNNLEYDVSDAITLRSITGYRGLDVHEFGDLSGNTGLRGLLLNPATGAVTVGAVTPFQSQNFSHQRQFSQELQLLGSAGNRVNYVAGVYYFRENVRQDNPQNFTFVIRTPDGLPLGINQQRTVAYTGVNKSYAAFAQMNYTPPILDDRLEVTVGGRYSEDKRKLDQADTVFGAPALNRQLNRTDNDFSYAVSALYEVTDAVNVYGQYTTGYKSGGFNPADLISDEGYAPERVKNIEVGLKSELFDRRLRLNLAGFYTDYTDRQIAVLLTSPTGGAANSTQNAGAATIKGIEVEAVAVPVEGLTLEATLGYIDPEYTRYDFRTGPGQPLIDVSDEARFHYQTKLTSHVAAQYEFPEMSFGVPLVRVEYNHRGQRYFHPLDRVSPLNATIIDPGFDDVQALISLSQIPLGNDYFAQLSVYGRNLLDDDDHITAAIDFGALGFSEAQYVMPRSFGVSLTMEIF